MARGPACSVTRECGLDSSSSVQLKTQHTFLLAAFSGVLYFVGFIGFDQWYLEWIAFAPVLIALDSVTTHRRAILLSWFMGWVTHLGGYYWIVQLLETFGQLPMPVAVLGYLLLCLFQSGVLALFGYLAWLLSKRTNTGIGWFAAPALMAAELVYPQLFQSYTANSQAWMPVLIQIADIGGVLLLSGVIALFGGAVAQVIINRMRRRAAPRMLVFTALGAFAFTIVYGMVRMPQIEARDAAAAKLKVAIVQANVGESDKHLKAEEGIERYRNLTMAAIQKPDLGLIVWPETAFNNLVSDKDNLSGHLADEIKVPMLVGAIRAEPNSRSTKPDDYNAWNSILSVQRGGQVVGHYDKIKLLMFGETLPFYDRWPGFYDKLLQYGILPYISVWSRGESRAALPVNQYRISADVCVEDIMPQHIRSLMGPIDASGTRPHAMFNGTNDSWYGPVEPRIHLALSMFRSVEHRRWLIRSTATGISAFINSNGRIVSQSDFEQSQLLFGDVPMIVGGPTIYGVIGDAVGWISLVGIIGLLLYRRRSAITVNG
jgi:apolipoprotein N-acyltransferase